MTNDFRQSDGRVVPKKSPNTSEPKGVEGMEGRRPAKGNARQSPMPRTQGRKEGMPATLERIRLTDRRHDLRQEPDAVIPLVRIREGGSPQGLSLPRPRGA